MGSLYQKSFKWMIYRKWGNVYFSEYQWDKHVTWPAHEKVIVRLIWHKISLKTDFEKKNKSRYFKIY